MQLKKISRIEPSSRRPYHNTPFLKPNPHLRFDTHVCRFWSGDEDFFYFFFFSLPKKFFSAIWLSTRQQTAANRDIQNQTWITKLSLKNHESTSETTRLMIIIIIIIIFPSKKNIIILSFNQIPIRVSTRMPAILVR